MLKRGLECPGASLSIMKRAGDLGEGWNVTERAGVSWTRLNYQRDVRNVKSRLEYRGEGGNVKEKEVSVREQYEGELRLCMAG